MKSTRVICMKYEKHYVTLWLHFFDRQAQNQVKTTVEELASVLQCSERNVKLLTKSLADHKMIRWEAGNGRGNTSTLTFLAEIEKVASRCLLDLLKKGDHRQFTSLATHKNLPASLKPMVNELINRKWDFSAESGADDHLETIRLPVWRKLLPIDPPFINMAIESFLCRQIYDTLITYNLTTGGFEPHIAHSWECNAKGTEWTFHLRKGVRFHHGRTVTSYDVKHSFERIRKLSARCSWKLKELIEIETVDPQTISFTSGQAQPFFLHAISSIGLSIVPFDTDQKKMIGSGPFRAAKYAGNHVRLETFPDYFKERPLVDRIELVHVPSETYMQMNYQLMEESDTGKQSDKENDLTEWGCHYALFNMNKEGPSQDLMFRKAIKLLLDQKAMVDELKGVRIAPANSFLPERSKLCTYEQSPPSLIEESLTKSRYRGETLHIYYLAFREMRETAEWIQEKLYQFGVKTKLVSFALTDLKEVEMQKQADLVVMVEILENHEYNLLETLSNDDSLIRQMASGEQLQNLQPLLDLYMHELAEEKRVLHLDRIEQYLNDQYLVLYLYHVKRKIYTSPSIRGAMPGPFAFLDVQKLWIQKGGTK